MTQQPVLPYAMDRLCARGFPMLVWLLAIWKAGFFDRKIWGRFTACMVLAHRLSWQMEKSFSQWINCKHPTLLLLMHLAATNSGKSID